MSFQKPKKRFSQNFLVDEVIASKIVDLLEIRKDDTILEIGTGRGILTQTMANMGARIYSFEIDRTLIEELDRKFKPSPNVKIVNQDFLKIEPGNYCSGGFKLIGNIPYDITSPVLEWMLKYRSRLTRAVITAQLELADRISSSPGSKNWAPIAIFCQCRFDIKKEMTISPKAFYPPPKVTSATLVFNPREEYQIADWGYFEKVVRLSFAHRRKLLANNLSVMDGFSRETIDGNTWPTESARINSRRADID